MGGREEPQSGAPGANEQGSAAQKEEVGGQPRTVDEKDSGPMAPSTPAPTIRPTTTSAVDNNGSLQRTTTHETSASRRSQSRRGPVRRFWNKYVSLTVETKDSRDHLALERTFLAYLRTGSMLAMLGVFMAQFYVLPKAYAGFGYSTISRPMAAVCIASALATVLVGAWRFWRYQHALSRGKALSGGYELLFVCVLLFLLVCLFFALFLGVNILHDTAARYVETGTDSGS